MAEGRIIKALSGFYYVKSEDTIFACKGRGVFRKRKVSPLVGDFVSFQVTDELEGYITEIKPRDNALKRPPIANINQARSEEHTSELQSRGHLVCRLLLEKKEN